MDAGGEGGQRPGDWRLHRGARHAGDAAGGQRRPVPPSQGRLLWRIRTHLVAPDPDGDLAEYLAQAGRVGIIDYHTGLGPWGYGERSVIDVPESPGFARARAWYGAAITSPSGGTSTSAAITGDGLEAAVRLLPHAEVTGMAIEIGTLALTEVLDALRADAWLHGHGDPLSPEAVEIKSRIRAAFFGDADDWKGMVLGQSLLATRQALAALAG